jgi:protoporphyrinogen oxidase
MGNLPKADQLMASVPSKPVAVIIGAGPAGLTAAYELASRTGISPIVLEQSADIGGLSRTINYKGWRMDIGGHRFFSKSDRVMKWWLRVLPLAEGVPERIALAYQGQQRSLAAASVPSTAPPSERVMLVRDRKSRIYFLRQFFDYPLRLSGQTLRRLGFVRVLRIGFSYLRSVIRQIKPEENLEEFFINRFGRELYQTFFRSYTEKVWGVPCRQISAAWGAQRVKGLSMSRAVIDVLKKALRPGAGIRQEQTETSLIEKFLYPKYGPGQLWECVAEDIKALGGSVLTGWTVDRIHFEGSCVAAVEAVSTAGERRRFDAEFVFSTMPVKELIPALDVPVPDSVREISQGLLYRDFITVGVLVKKLRVCEGRNGNGGLLKDNWIYIQEPDVQLGRLQIFNNWSPGLIADQSKVWLGLEYFCNESDAIWKLDDAALAAFAAEELARIGMIDAADVLDATVVRVPKTYPAYFGTAYERFPALREWLDGIPNLFLIGRNGMHCYNNQDHSMLTAMIAVDNIIDGRTDKGNIWSVNTEQEYHEAKR